MDPNGKVRYFNLSSTYKMFIKLTFKRIIFIFYFFKLLFLFCLQADPYLICSLGKKVFKDKDKYVSKQLCPEFGR